MEFDQLFRSPGRPAVNDRTDPIAIRPKQLSPVLMKFDYLFR
jgi:hypothetical protein